ALMNQLSADEAVIFADAVHPTHTVRPVGCWAPKETPVAVEQSSGRDRLNIHGAISLETGQTVMKDVLTADAASTIMLLMAIDAMFPDKRRDCQNFCVRDVIISPPLGKMTVSASDRPGKCIILADLCSLVRSKRRFLRPDLPCHRQSRASRVKFAAQRRDRSHAQPPLGGEHGEDPRFDRAERGAMLRQGGASHG